ncbi:hypothetical protein BJX61DRAFT_501519 [Aspergillus egyptiacus]|nr:hypothetical protein BJX61DRAFT_501519 [Aspergillus egyptiacus]
MQAFQPLLAVAFLALAAAQDDTESPKPSNPIVELSSCQALSCNAPDGSICALGETSWPEVGVGMASNAVKASAANLSLTLIDGLAANGFTGYIYEGYEYSDQSLFVGVDPGLSDNNYPSGCALMMQYQGQTFPTQWFPETENLRDQSFQNTTACNGVLDASCQSSIVEIIRSFNSNNTSEDQSGDKCSRLTQHVNNRLRGDEYTCGQSSWVANFMNVTGGSLPSPNTAPAGDERLGNDQCRPVLPQNNNLYKVADMRLFSFVDPPASGKDFYSPIFGGRSGFTPVMTVLYGEQNDSPPDVQFTCMKTFERDGDPREDQFEGGAVAGPRVGSSVLVALLFLVHFAVLF